MSAVYYWSVLWCFIVGLPWIPDKEKPADWLVHVLLAMVPVVNTILASVFTVLLITGDD